MKMDIKKMSNRELEEEYRNRYDLIYRVECYGSRDLLILEAIGEELYHRGIEIVETPTPLFIRHEEE